jgi:hypothetical protein
MVGSLWLNRLLDAVKNTSPPNTPLAPQCFVSFWTISRLAEEERILRYPLIRVRVVTRIK